MPPKPRMAMNESRKASLGEKEVVLSMEFLFGIKKKFWKEITVTVIPLCECT